MVSLLPIATVVVALTGCAVANAEPAVTAVAHLAPRATDPSLVGYISQSGTYTDARSCDFPQTVSTSGNYVQCCPTTGSCPFYTSCSSNTLVGGGATVPCDVNTALTCNTGIVLATVGAAGGPSYLACWQTTLGNNPFTFVQNIGSATPAAGSATTSAAASGNTAQSSASRSSSSTSASRSGSSTSAASSSMASSNAAAGASSDAQSSNSLIGGLLVVLGQMLL